MSIEPPSSRRPSRPTTPLPSLPRLPVATALVVGSATLGLGIATAQPLPVESDSFAYRVLVDALERTRTWLGAMARGLESIPIVPTTSDASVAAPARPRAPASTEPTPAPLETDPFAEVAATVPPTQATSSRLDVVDPYAEVTTIAPRLDVEAPRLVAVVVPRIEVDEASAVPAAAVQMRLASPVVAQVPSAGRVAPRLDLDDPYP